MYRKILVPMDGSDIAECVLPHIEKLATGSKPAEVTFLYVVQPLDTPMTDLEFRARIESEGKSAAERYLKGLIEKLDYKENAKGDVILGKPADSIIDYASQNGMKLIIMATHGLSGISRWVRGSVADKVLHEAKIPVWLIRANAPQKRTYKRKKKITMLVPLDGSELAEEALPSVRSLAGQFNATEVEITLVRVCELFLPPYHYPPSGSVSWEEYIAHEKKRCEEICKEYLSGVAETLGKDGFNVVVKVLDGNPAEAIMEYDNTKNFDLIVMSTHGRTGISRWAMGSIADKVVKGANSPVFLVRSLHSGHGEK
jgi:nucleotide-binding universal stress UspA family protein